MASKILIPLVTTLVYLVASQEIIQTAIAAGECGRTPIGAAAASLSPCLNAASNARAKVSPICCSKVNGMIRTSPRCLCAVLLSPMARKAGINPAVAITIPKRCNIKNRSVGKKCGPYTVP